VHLVVDRDRIDADTGLILRTEKSVLFVIPWDRSWIIGTTDTAWDLPKEHPAVSARDIDYLLDHVNEVLRVPLRRDDIVGVYAGLRPLVAGKASETTKLSREHLVGEPVPGLTVVAGGKYTTYRVMAEDTVDEVLRRMGRDGPPSVTRAIPLVGAEGYAAMWNQREALAAAAGLPVDRVEHLLHRYGSLVPEVLDLIAANPRLGEPVPGAEQYLRAELRYGASHEGARHLDDVLTRRTRISIEVPDRGIAAAEVAARLVAPVLGWSAEDGAREVARYRERVTAERAAQDQPDDVTAEAVRLQAPDLPPVG
jgi:glycerol-3-phosphate dehydrogenase